MKERAIAHQTKACYAFFGKASGNMPNAVRLRAKDLTMKRRTPAGREIAPRISVAPEVRFGRPVIAGTRIPVTVILDELAAGSTIEEVVREYGVTDEDVRAVLRYASHVIADEDIQVARG